MDRPPVLYLTIGMNLQICFMNETASDSESPGSDTEVKPTLQPASLPFVKVSLKLSIVIVTNARLRISQVSVKRLLR